MLIYLTELVPALIIGVSVVLVTSQKNNYVQRASTRASEIDEQRSKIENPLDISLVVNHDGGDDRRNSIKRLQTKRLSQEFGLKPPLDESRGTNVKSNYTLENDEIDQSRNSITSSSDIAPETLEVPNRLDFMQLKRDPTASLKKIEEELKDSRDARSSENYKE